MKYLIFPLFILGLTSCNSANKEAINQVVEIQSKVLELKNTFEAVDIKKLTNAKKQYDESIALVKRYYYKDTIDVQFMNSLDYYRNIKSSHKVILKNKLIIKDNLAIVEEELNHLRTDLENNSIQGEQLSEALKNEQDNLFKLDSTITLYSQNAALILFVHDSIAGYVKKQTLSF